MEHIAYRVILAITNQQAAALWIKDRLSSIQFENQNWIWQFS